MSEFQDTFKDKFFDIRTNKPQKGQVMACYTAMADFIESNEKRNLIDLLKKTEKGFAAAQVMRKLHHASEPDCYRVPKEMAIDLLNMTDDEVLNKPYRYKIELFYYTQKENIPTSDPHWSCISLLNLYNDQDIKVKFLTAEGKDFLKGLSNEEIPMDGRQYLQE